MWRPCIPCIPYFLGGRGLLGFGMLAVFFGAPAAAGERAHVVLLHTTDLRGHLLPLEDYSAAPASHGLARVASYAREVRAEGTPVVLLDGGDCLQGSPLEAIHQARGDREADPMIAAMNALGYDAMTIGDHDFDWGLPALRKASREAKFPLLAADIVDSSGRPAFPAYVVRQAGAVRVGIAGINARGPAARLDATRTGGLRFGAPLEAARRVVEHLRTAERCDLVVLVARAGLRGEASADATDPGHEEITADAIARAVQGVDVLVMGRTHERVPSVLRKETLCSQAGRWAEQVGRVDLELEREEGGGRFRVVEREARLVSMEDVPPDSALLALALPYQRRTEAALDEVIVVSSAQIASPHGRAADGPAWQLVHRALLEASGADVSVAALIDAKAALPAGPIRMRDVMRLYPDEDRPALTELTGEELRALLESEAARFRPYRYEARDRTLFGPQESKYRAAHGVSYEIDLTRPTGSRIVGLRLGGEPLAEDRRLRVVMSGDLPSDRNTEPLRIERRSRPGGGGTREILIDFLRAQKTLPLEFHPAWRVLPDFAPLPERPLLDRLVRYGTLAGGDTLRVWPENRATRGDFCYWLAHAFGWRDKRRSNAFADVPDSLEPWLDALLARRVLGEQATLDRFRPFAPLARSQAIEWALGAARAARYRLPGDPLGLEGFRRSLLTGIAAGPRAVPGGQAGRPGMPPGDTLTRAQALAIVSNLRFPTVRVLETTDFHGAILPGARDPRTGRAWGGSAVLAAYLDSLRGENPEGTVLVDGGDLFQGTMISNLQYGRPIVEQMNVLGYTAVAIGNHEFDWSVDTLARRLSELRAAPLGANIVERARRQRPRWARADTLVSRRGVTLALLGYAYPGTPSVTLPSKVVSLEFRPVAPFANARIPELRRQGASAVVLLGHLPGEAASHGGASGAIAEVARSVRGEDLVLGGHSHNVLVARVDSTPVMIPGARGQWIGVADLVVDPVAHRVVEHHLDLVATYEDRIQPDTAMARLVTRWNAPVARIAAEPIASNDTLLARSSDGESLAANLVTDAMRVGVSADVALHNPGGVRADLPAGPVTRGRLYEVMPFDNTMVVLQLDGRELRRSLEDALAYDIVTQVSGLRYRYDLDRPRGERVTFLGDEGGRPLPVHSLYRVVCNSFMAEGGNHYVTLARAPRRTDTGLLVREVLEDYVASFERRGRPLSYRPEGRVVPEP